MEALIKITEHEGKRLVSARELHFFLESKQDFSTWIKSRIGKYGFVQNQDFISFHKIVERAIGATVQIEYLLTIDTAKELSMLENNYNGKKARRYFIEIEKSFKEIITQNSFLVPKTFKEALLLAAEQQGKIEEQQKQLIENKPKVEFYDTVMQSEDTIDMNDVAKTLNMGIGRNNLFKFLRENGILMKNSKPYQRYIDNGWFKTVESNYNKNNNETFIYIKTVVFQKGVDGIRKLLDSKGFKKIT